jgi:hypothetical protein
MISDSDFAPDDFEIEDKFQELLAKLSASKESITRASRYALDNCAYHQPLFQLIAKQLKKVRFCSYKVHGQRKRTMLSLEQNGTLFWSMTKRD